MSDESGQKILPLGKSDHDRLKAQRAVVEAFLDEESLEKYQRPAGKLGTIRALLAAKVFRPSQTRELQCLGIVLGDALVQELAMEWVMVEDEYGRDPAIRLPGTTIIPFPLTMISKRVEKGEEVDVFELFNWVASQIDEMGRKNSV